jgi:hypothetical protein
MIIDQNLKLALKTAALVLVLALAYSIYAGSSSNGLSGRSAMGIAFGIGATAIFVSECLLSARKKFVAHRIGRVQTWLRAHIWLGLLSFPLILLHSGFRWGSGLAAALMWLTTIVLVSGVTGMVLQHCLPRLMQKLVDNETVYEQIPNRIKRLPAEADRQFERLTGGAGLQNAGSVRMLRTSAEFRTITPAPQELLSPEIIDDMKETVRSYLMDQPTSPATKLLPVRKSIQAYFGQLRRITPFEVHGILNDLEDICEERRQLALQRRLHHWLHGWLLIHVPTSFALLVLTFVHAVLALKY